MSRHESGRKEAGFALIITLSLLALLMLAVFALSSLVRVSGQVSSAGGYQVQARQNALLGLNLGLSELQRLAGNDAVVTGMAGVVGIPAKDSLRQWCGVWNSSGSNVTWLASGALSQSTPAIRSDLTRIRLVSNGSVGTPTDSTEQEPVEVGKIPLQAVDSTTDAVTTIGNFAYWVGDEGVKLSAAIAAAEVPQNPAGVNLWPDLRRLLGSGFTTQESVTGKLLTFEQASVAFGSSLSAGFHQVTASARFLASSVPFTAPRSGNFVVGAFNINTTSQPAWRGLFEFPSSVSTASTDLSLNSSQSLRLAQRVAAAISARGRPFTSAREMDSAGIIGDALNATPKITGVTEQQVLDAIQTLFTVRSDTFRIRGYGESLNPADATKVEASAYCEAIVQRTTDTAPNGLGRRFVITYFRWLGPDDI